MPEPIDQHLAGQLASIEASVHLEDVVGCAARLLDARHAKNATLADIRAKALRDAIGDLCQHKTDGALALAALELALLDWRGYGRTPAPARQETLPTGSALRDRLAAAMATSRGDHAMDRGNAHVPAMLAARREWSALADAALWVIRDELTSARLRAALVEHVVQDSDGHYEIDLVTAEVRRLTTWLAGRFRAADAEWRGNRD